MWLLDLIRCPIAGPKASSSTRLRSTAGPPSLQGQSVPTGSSRMVACTCPYFPEEPGEDSLCSPPQDNPQPSRRPQACCAHGPEELTPSPPPPLSNWDAGSLPWEPPISAIRQAQAPGSSVCACQPAWKQHLTKRDVPLPGFSLRLRLVEWHFLQPLLQPWHPVRAEFLFLGLWACTIGFGEAVSLSR